MPIVASQHVDVMLGETSVIGRKRAQDVRPEAWEILDLGRPGDGVWRWDGASGSLKGVLDDAAVGDAAVIRERANAHRTLNIDASRDGGEVAPAGAPDRPRCVRKRGGREIEGNSAFLAFELQRLLRRLAESFEGFGCGGDQDAVAIRRVVPSILLTFADEERGRARVKEKHPLEAAGTRASDQRHGSPESIE
ncbi:MAG: hypothetical protein Q8S13_14585, partial [Dehalococcoidia bacterium]|nr:hypothetical protein [Dehalococcoidia bacterium]